MSNQRISRRQMLAFGAAGAGGLLLHYGLRSTPPNVHVHPSENEVSQAGVLAVRAASSPIVRHFEVPLPIPQVAQPSRTDSTTDYYDIRMQQNRQEILPGLKATIWGYNGIYPGPTIEARRGRRIMMTQTNDLPEPMSIHYHGGITAPEHDGYAEDIVVNGATKTTLIQPGKSWTYEYPNQQPAATNWYHDHAIHTTGAHVYKGLAGFYLLRDDEEDSFNLPKGEHEIPLVFQDRLFDSRGELLYDNHSHAGVEGDVQLVNGAPWPRLKVAARKYRFRLLNGSNWRRYDLALTGALRMTQIGTDSGFLRKPTSISTLRLFSGERSDVIIDFSGLPVGTTITLRNRAKEADGKPMADVMLFEVVRSVSDDSQIPATLSDFEDLTTPAAIASATRTRTFTFDRGNGFYQINGKIWDKNRFDANPRLGTTEIWKFINPGGGWFHPIHVHLIHFQILDRKEGGKVKPPELWERGRKDVAALGENQEIRVIIKWDAARYLNFTGSYMIHCHNVDHEDHDMMTQYQLLPA